MSLRRKAQQPVTPLTPEQTAVMERVEQHATQLAAAINDAAGAGISTAYLLPQLIAILRASGFPVPAGLPFG